jgi:hypothetical protein
MAQVAMSRCFRVKEVMRDGIASVTQLRMTNEDVCRERAAQWKLEMKLFRVEGRTSPRAPMPECDQVLGVVGYRVICLDEPTYCYPH